MTNVRSRRDSVRGFDQRKKVYMVCPLQAVRSGGLAGLFHNVGGNTWSRPGRGSRYPDRIFVVIVLILLAFLLSALLVDLLHGFAGELLAEEALNDILLAGAPVTNHDQHTTSDVAADGAAKDDSGKGEGPHAVVDAPRASTKGDL